ncbi:BglG family transcription antiterminator [Salinicoccus albus]|uniref:BglG family transcription antiterminator n=1 Tax=Salinicoccus albus TaxID=418756 RepID=UPI0003720E54|nr:BglG family transcription antiterminator [Salinicoccus albus]
MISSREKKIINELMYHNGTFMLIKEIAGKLGVSSRTVHRELKNVRETLFKLNIKLRSEYKKGVKLELAPLEVDALSKFITEHADKDLSSEEKKVVLVYNLILNQEGLKKSALAVELGISEHTVDELISQMDEQLKTFNLEIKKTRAIGIQLIGDELAKQNFLADMMINELNSNSIYSVIENNFVFSSLINNKIIGILEADNIFKVERLLMDELDVLPYQLTENAYLNLTLHIVLAIDRTENEQNIAVREALKEELKETQEYFVSSSLRQKLEYEFESSLPEEEVYFIAMHLRGSRRKFQESLVTHSVEALTTAFIEQVSARMNYPFYAYPELKDGLVLHIEPTLHRQEAGIITVNPLVDTVKENYPDLFEVVRETFEEQFGITTLDESETGFLTIHFGGILHGNPKVEVTTVCSSGIGTSRILANQLKSRFNNLYIRQELSISDLKAADIHDGELVLSTVPLDMDSYILVSPLVDEHDEYKILEAISKISDSAQVLKKSTEPQSFHIDPDKVIQASELYLNRIFINQSSGTGAIESVKSTLADQRSLDTEAIEGISDKLINRYERTGLIIGKRGFSFPHIKSPLIKRHQLVFIHNEKGIKDKNYNDEAVLTSHQILMLVPEETLISDLLSDISVLFGENHEYIEALFRDQTPIEEIIKTFIQNIYRTERHDL